ncbi:MAG: uracil-DNA glycosylase [Patescibacteria group bacterium]|jgi:uracil-DNA glycosylase
MAQKVIIEPEWLEALGDIITRENFTKLANFVRAEYQLKKVFPLPADIFKAFWLTPFSQVKVVILGQDPYHGDGQAHGLCFSVPDGVSLPPSLQNIYKEIESDLNIKKNFSLGNLESWARQGVFLLNAILTVVAHTPTSHRDKGWEDFTDAAIKKISDGRENIVFILWGSYARSKKNLIDGTRHLVLEAPHPSPFSAHSGFFGCKHFSLCNKYLTSHNKTEIVW